MGGMVHAILKSPIEMGECFSAATEAHVLAEVVPPLFAVVTVATHDACLYGDTLTWYEIFDPWTDGCHDACCFVA